MVVFHLQGVTNFHILFSVCTNKKGFYHLDPQTHLGFQQLCCVFSSSRTSTSASSYTANGVTKGILTNIGNITVTQVQ